MITPRRSLRLPIILAIVMIVMLVALIVGWVILAAVRAREGTSYPGLYWTLLSVGTTFLVVVLGGTICYLVLSIKTINLNRRQTNFIASVTHELKSPITSLKLYLQTLGRHQVSIEERAEFQQYMLDDVERLDHLINHLLDAAQLEKRSVMRMRQNCLYSIPRTIGCHLFRSYPLRRSRRPDGCRYNFPQSSR